MSERIDVLAVMDKAIPTLRHYSFPQQAPAMTEARAAVAELIERERQQREVLELLCDAYIANRGAIGESDFVRCLTVGGRLAGTAIGRLWLQAAALARVGGAS